MTIAIQSIVEAYVKQQNIDALYRLKDHRENLLKEVYDTEHFSFAVPRQRCEDDLAVIKAGLKTLMAADYSVRGHVDIFEEGRIEGWAQNSKRPEDRIAVEIVFDGRLVGETLADRYRADLKEAGIGSGYHGFSFIPPQGLLDVELMEVRGPDGGVIGAKNA